MGDASDQHSSPASATEVPDYRTADKLDPEYYINRDLSEQAFHRRVLHQAQDDRKPLLERTRFLGLATDNIDEFSMKRIGKWKRHVANDIGDRTPDGRTPREIWHETLETVEALLHDQAACYQTEIKPALADAGIEIVGYGELSPSERETVAEYFESSILPTLTPLSFDSAHPFPHISNLSLSLAVLTRDAPDDDPKFSRVKLPENRPRFIEASDDRYILLEDVIAAHLESLFPGVEIVDASLFRVTRNAEVERDEEQAEDLVDMIEDVLEKRRFAPVVRLDITPDMPEAARSVLVEQLDLEEREVIEVPGPLDYRDFLELADLDRPELKYDSWTPQPHPRFHPQDDPDDFFGTIRERDVLIHHPYHSFSGSVQQFFDLAARDPKVLAIKASIYRTEEQSQVVQSLIDAARNGKQVAANVELKARFDEKRNIQWVEQLEEEGIHVSYGTVGLKTHTKTGVVVREEDDGVRVYSHVGTGNYNSETAKIYEDLSLLTANQAIGQDLIKLFNFFTGRSLHQDYEELLVAPANMKAQFIDLIQAEAERARAGETAKIVAKMNRLEHPEVIKELYAAAQAGVDIDLVVRDICCLRPGVEGLSENIDIYSIVGRFLEHSRIFYFHAGGEGNYFIGSADWMVRNLENRVESIVPVSDPKLQEYLQFVLEVNRTDNYLAWELQSDGTYELQNPDGEQTRSTHQILMDRARENAFPHLDF